MTQIDTDKLRALDDQPYLCAGCGKPFVGERSQCDCATGVGYKRGLARIILCEQARVVTISFDKHRAFLAMAEDNRRLREALEYYANPDMYDSGDVPGHIYALDDRGGIARGALLNAKQDTRSIMEILGEIARGAGFKPTQKYMGAMFLGYDYARRVLTGQLRNLAAPGDGG